MTRTPPDQQDAGQRRAGRPAVGLLSRQLILDEAFALADDAGAADTDFTLAALAKKLGVQAPAIYNYFRNKAELISAMRGQLAHRVDSSAFDEIPWHEAILPWARSYIECLGGHPGTIAALATLPVDEEPDSIANYERIAASMRRGRVPEHRIVPALIALESFIIGSALDALAPESNLSPGKNAELAPELDRVERLARAFANDEGRTLTNEVFEFGLSVMIAGRRGLVEPEALPDAVRSPRRRATAPRIQPGKSI